MSKAVASESNEGQESGGMSRKREAGDEGDENEEGIPEVAAADNSTTSTNVTTAPAATDQFMHTPEFKRHFVKFVHVQMLMALRLETKGFNAAADALIDKGVMSGELMVHGGNDISEEVAAARKERRKLATRAIFLLNITKVGENTCWLAVNFVVVEIPEGVERIGEDAFVYCTSLTTISFPKTLTLIDYAAFGGCSSLENFDLLHTNLQELRGTAFGFCSELKSMTIPDSLQTLGYQVFEECFKIVPSSFDVRGVDGEGEELPDPTSEVVALLRSKQQAEVEQVEAERTKQGAERIKQEKNDARDRRLLQH